MPSLDLGHLRLVFFYTYVQTNSCDFSSAKDDARQKLAAMELPNRLMSALLST